MRLLSSSRQDKVADLVVVNTLNKRSELLQFGDSGFLVYDQYLGQTISEMSRLFFAADSPEDAKPFGLRLMSEEASCCGNIALATFFAYLYSINYHDAHEYKSKETQEIMTKRAAAVEIQEAYIIAHENAHYLWESNLKTTDALLDILLDDEENDRVDEVIQSYLDDISFQYHGRDVPHAANIQTDEDVQFDKAERIKLREMFFSDNKKRQLLNAQLKKEPGFREEIYADLYAATICLKMYEQEVKPEDLVVAIHLAMENITTVSQVISNFHALIGMPVGEDVTIIATRKRALRRVLQMWADGSWGWKAISKANQRFMRLIRDPMTFDLRSRLGALPSSEVLSNIRAMLLELVPESIDPQFIIRMRPFRRPT